MNKHHGPRISLLLICLAFAALAPTNAFAQGALHRLSSQFQNFDGTETFTDLPVPGISAYSHAVNVPAGDNVLYVTISATSDQHMGNAAWFSCNVDGVFCNPGQGGADDAPPGWLSLAKHFNYDNVTYNGGMSGGDGSGGNGDMHDNVIYYTWCTNISPGNHTVEIRLASSQTGGGAGTDDNVFFEGAHFLIDSSAQDAGCGPSLTQSGTTKNNKN